MNSVYFQKLKYKMKFQCTFLIFIKILLCSLFFLSPLKKSYGSPEVPMDQVPSMRAQYKAYQELYSSLNRPEFQGQEGTRPLPNLHPILRIGYSYVRKIFEEEQAPQVIRDSLKASWHESHQRMQRSGLTLYEFYEQTEILSIFLGSLWQYKYHDDQESLKNLSTTDLQHLITKGNLQKNRYPLCFEAILFVRDGELPPSTFIDAFHHNPALGITALPYQPYRRVKAQEEFINRVENPYDFYLHDRGHWLVTVQNLEVQSADEIHSTIGLIDEKALSVMHQVIQAIGAPALRTCE